MKKWIKKCLKIEHDIKIKNDTRNMGRRMNLERSEMKKQPMFRNYYIAMER